MNGAKSIFLGWLLTCSLIVGAECLNRKWTDDSKQQNLRVLHQKTEQFKELASDLIERSPAEAAEVWHEGYRLGLVILDWDRQRSTWLEQNSHLRFTSKGKPRVILVTSSLSKACPSPSGDHYLVKSIKNKMDYTRLHEIEIYYNMVVMEQQMTDFWIKLPLLRKLMLTHPEAEWIWWMDSDAIFANMAFEIPFEKYKDHNMIIHGWESEIYDEKNWVGINAGIFLLRNCQWSLNLLDLWAALGENYGDNRQKVGKLLSETLKGRPNNFVSDDQASLVYLLSTSKNEELKPKVYIESSYNLHGYWVWEMKKLDEALTQPQSLNEPSRAILDSQSFIIHFVGCKICEGTFASYPLEKCLEEMERAYNFADNQVLRMFGFQHEGLGSSDVEPVSGNSQFLENDTL